MAPKAATKRPAACAGVKAESCAKRPAVARGSAKQCSAVAEALLKSQDFPADVLEMLRSNLPACLGAPRERRHEFQERVAGMVGEVLTKGEEGLQAVVAAGEAKLAAITAENDRLHEAALAAADKLKASEEELAAAQAASEEAGKALVSAEDALAAAAAGRAAFATELGEVDGRKAKLGSVRDEAFVPVRDGSIEPAKANKAVAAIEAVGKDFSFDGTLLRALSSAGKKALADRSGFDVVVMEQVAAEFARCERALDEQLANAVPAKAEHEAKVQAAGDEVEGAKSKDRGCAAALDAAKAEQKEATALKRASVKAARENSLEVKQAKAELEQAKCSLQEFREGPLAMYRELHARSDEIPAEPEKKVEPDAPTVEASVPEGKVLEVEEGLPAPAPVIEAGA